MYDSGKVIVGILVFLALMSSPFWLNAGRVSKVPEPKKPAVEKGKECVESNAYMRANHMQMVDEWRNEVVREAERDYLNTNGKKFRKSLTLTCLDCHDEKKEFCDKCHTYAGVKPYCWECHIDPKEKL
jgi:hypothetical protein